MGMFVGAVLIGALATAALDLWNIFLNRTLGYALPNWGMVGRWFGHLGRGRIHHENGIAKSEPVANELALGWIGHYVIGIAFAVALLVIWPGWLKAPTFWPPMIVGWVTVLCGWLILSPGLGNGWAHAKTPTAMRARILNIAAHTIFGLALWAGGLLLRGFV